MSKIRKFFLNGTIMTFCAILIRTVAMGFNVYIAGAAGAEAVGLYSLLSGVYGFAATIALSGINLAVTRLISEALALNDNAAIKSTMKRCFLYAAFFGISASFLLLFLTKPIAAAWLDEIRVIKPLKLLSVCLPMIATSSVINGYFTAVRRVFKNAVSQLTEMTVRILITVILFSYSKSIDPEFACLLLVCGSVTGEFVVFIVNIALYISDRRSHFKNKTPQKIKPKCAPSVLSIALPVALTSYIRSALLSIEHALIPKGLEKYGSGRKKALASYGTLSGMALPVINFPYALIGAFSSLLIPEVSESRAKGEKRHIRYITHRTYQCGVFFAIGISGMFYIFAPELGEALYSSHDAATYIRLIAPLVPIMYTDSVTDAILKGMGEQVYSMKVNIADALISVILVYLLVPIYGISGYIATIYFAEVLNAALSIYKMVRVTGFCPSVAKLILRPMICTIGTVAIFNIAKYAFPRDYSVIYLTVLIVAYCVTYVLLVGCLGGFSKEDIKWIKDSFSKT